MTTPPANQSGGPEGGDVAALRAQLDQYRKTADDLRRRLNAHARARAELDRAQDALADARARAEVFHSTQPRDRRPVLVAQSVHDDEACARAARDAYRNADRDLERAKVAERAAREELAARRVLVLLLLPLNGVTL